MLDAREKKMRDDLTKFFKSLEKYYIAYINDPKNYGVAINPALLQDKESKALLKKKKKYIKKDDGSYFLKLVEKYRGHFVKTPCVITLQKLPDRPPEALEGPEGGAIEEESKPRYEIIDITPPKIPPKKDRKLLPEDEIWVIMPYKGLTPEQKYKKYRKLSIKIRKKQLENEQKLKELKKKMKQNGQKREKKTRSASRNSTIQEIEPEEGLGRVLKFSI